MGTETEQCRRVFERCLKKTQNSVHHHKHKHNHKHKKKKNALSLNFHTPRNSKKFILPIPKTGVGANAAAFLQYQKFRPNIPANIITVINRQKSEKNKADSLGIFYSEFPDLERWIKKANWEKDPFDFPEGNGNGEQPKVSRNPDCPRCRGSGLYERDRAPDGSPIMSSCNCERDGPNESKTAKPAASTLQSTG